MRETKYLYLTTKEARKAAEGKLPKPGRERLLCLEGVHWWLRRSSGAWECQQGPWCLRTTPWVLVEGIATLRGGF